MVAASIGRPIQPQKDEEFKTYIPVRYKPYRLDHDKPRWEFRGKTKNQRRMREDWIRYTFCKYRVPKFLFQAWHEMYETKHVRDVERVYEELDFRMWFIWIAQGISLHKMINKRRGQTVLTKKEFHSFTQAPDDMTPLQAVWWAKALNQSGDLGIANRIARSNIGNSKNFIRDSNDIDHQLMIFFCNNPEVDIKEINDIMDYINRYCVDEDPFYSIKGRSLQSIRKGMEQWHSFLRNSKSMSHHNWKPLDIPNFACSFGKGVDKIRYEFNQITNGKNLALEGKQMRHCVYSYINGCKQGNTAIISVIRRVNMTQKNSLTIQVDLHYGTMSIRQVRGYANRLPNPQEQAAVRAFSNATGIRIQCFEMSR